jgi:TolB-like protein/AraC-like DNA-binding protein
MTEPLSMDQAFIRKLTDIVLANLSYEEFSVEKLAKEAGMSRVSVHRRIKSIKNQDLSQFIREIRLKRAMEMLQHNEGTATEIAFRVGFGSPTYFNKCFHDYFGFPPGEVRKREPAGTHQNLTDEQSLISVPFQESKKDAKVFLKKLRNKNILIASSGILFGLLVIYFLYVMFIKDSGNGPWTKPPEKSIVVLPFKNLSDDPENQYFADGIMEGILTNLFRIREISVRSRTTAEHFRENPMTSPQIARELNVNYVLEGSVYRSENNVRIFVQLIDARNDQHILSEKYESEMTNVFALSSDIAKKIANALETVLSQEEIGQIEKIPTKNPEAYDYYLKARFLVNKANAEQRVDISKGGLMGSLQYFEKAIAADKNYTEAYTGLATAWYNLSAYGWYKPYIDGIRKAKEFSMKALEIDPDCAEAHAVKGAYLIYPERRFEEASRELQTALQLNPNFSTAHQWYAQLLMITGPMEEARLHMDRVLDLEPYFWLMHNLNALIYYFEEKYDKAIEASCIARELNPNSLDNKWLFFLNYVKMDEGEKAAEALQAIARHYPDAGINTDEIMDAYYKSGIEGLFTWLIELNIHNPVPLEGLNGHPFYIAWWCAILGNREKSLYWFEKILETVHIPYHYFDLITTNPDFDILRDNPRFLKIIDEIGLTPYNTRKAK